MGAQTLRPDRNPETGLWGYVDDGGAWAIPPRFVLARKFNGDRAVVSMPESPELSGLIDRTGRFAVAPAWSQLQHFIGPYFCVTRSDGAIGLIDHDGTSIIAMHHADTDEQEEIARCENFIRGHPFMLELGRRLAQRVTDALAASETLAPMEGLLSDGRLGELELAHSTLSYKRVTLVADHKLQGTEFVIRGGDTGTIGWSYPNSASMFNLRIEAPVEGLRAFPQGSLGVPWRCLKLAKA